MLMTGCIIIAFPPCSWLIGRTFGQPVIPLILVLFLNYMMKDSVDKRSLELFHVSLSFLRFQDQKAGIPCAQLSGPEVEH